MTSPSAAAYPKKLIEVDLPLDIINAESAREKSIRHGHPSTLHLWWARRPLAACRAALFASLVDDPSAYLSDPGEIQEERQRLHDLIGRLVKWENSNDPNLLAAARSEIAASVARSRQETAPTEPAAVLDYLNRQAQPIYDPFCGGGSIPLEAQRLGLRAIGTDLNPVAVLITKALIELPPKFANRPPVNPDADPMGFTVGKGKQAKQVPWRGAAGLAADIRYYGRKMRELAWEKIGHLYPTAKLPEGGAATVIAWLWARTIPCANPACGIAMPLLKSFQVSKKAGNQHWIKPVVDEESKTVAFVVQSHGRDVPSGGNIDRYGATCVACGNHVVLEYVREQSRAGKLGEQMIGIVAEGNRKRLFLSPTDEHIQTAVSAKPEWRPNGKFPEQAMSLRVEGYGLSEWQELFTERQLTALTTISDSLQEIRNVLNQDGSEPEYSDAVCTYLALAIGRLLPGNCRHSLWRNAVHFVDSVFGRQAIPMVWDFAEANPFSNSSQNCIGHIEWVARVLDNLPTNTNDGEVHQANASTTIYAQSGPVIVTDPPYYDNISYAELSDFFYIWLRPLLRGIYPDLFSGILAPASEEMIAAPRFGRDSRERFEDLLNQTLRLIRERCSPDFPSSIFYAYKQQEEEQEGRTSTGWETMLTAIIDAGFQVVGTWPMRTELITALKANVNALASSVVMVCRPRPENAPPALQMQFRGELRAEVPAVLKQLTRESHIAPVDLRQAAIGPGMAVYSRYGVVQTPAGEPVTVRQALAAINDVVSQYLAEQAGAMDDESRFCLDWLLAHPSGSGSYGIAQVLALSYNLSIEDGLEQRHNLLTAKEGLVTLRDLEEYDEERPWPGRRAAMTAWEGVHRMAWQLLPGESGRGVEGCIAPAQRAADRLDDLERLARILYDIYDRQGVSAKAVAFNSVVVSWNEITRRAAEQSSEQRLL